MLSRPEGALLSAHARTEDAGDGLEVLFLAGVDVFGRLGPFWCGEHLQLWRGLWTSWPALAMVGLLRSLDAQNS